MADRNARVIVDTYATGGPDNAIAAAAKISLQRGIHVLLAGDERSLRQRLAGVSYDPMWLSTVHCPQPWARQTGDDLAARAALEVALPAALAKFSEDEADALVSASVPDVVLRLCTEHLEAAVEGLPVAEAAVFPTMPRRSTDDPLALLVDVSGTRSDGPHELAAFAMMGAAYARVVTGVRTPHVALLSTGLDPSSGPADVQAAHATLRGGSSMRFVGNLRAEDLPKGMADVVVVDGFSGHAVRGLLEALTDITVEAARYAWRKRVSWRVAMRLLSEGVGMLKRVSEFKEYGGAPVLGLSRPVIVADPDSSVEALANAIKLAAKCHRRDLVGEIQTAAQQFEGWRGAASK